MNLQLILQGDFQRVQFRHAVSARHIKAQANTEKNLSDESVQDLSKKYQELQAKRIEIQKVKDRIIQKQGLASDQPTSVFKPASGDELNQATSQQENEQYTALPRRGPVERSLKDGVPQDYESFVLDNINDVAKGQMRTSTLRLLAVAPVLISVAIATNEFIFEDQPDIPKVVIVCLLAFSVVYDLFRRRGMLQQSADAISEAARGPAERRRRVQELKEKMYGESDW